MAAADVVAGLVHKPDAYNGVIISEAEVPKDPAEFDERLRESLSAWKAQGKKGIWLRLPLSLATHVPVAAGHGFVFHHAQPSYVMMTTWLDGDTESTLPPGPSLQVGVGAIVLDSEGRILAVQEKSGPLKGTGVWKMPTGLLDAAEDIGAAAEREVMEETGIRARFEGIITYRHAHDFAFGNSDMFFVAKLRALSKEVLACPREIEMATWLPLDEFFDQPRFQASPLYRTVYSLIRAAVDENHIAPPPLIMGSAHELGFRPGTGMLYYPVARTKSG